MNRNRTGMLDRIALLLLAGALCATAAMAQDADDDTDSPKPLDRSQRVAVDFGSWVSQPAGLDYDPASRDDGGAFGDTLIPLRHGTEDDMRWRVAYRFPERNAEVAVAYYATKTASAASDSSPGLFVFGERLAYPAFAGYALDGRADAFDASSSTLLRDARIEYRKRLYAADDGLTVHGAIGWRRIWHARAQDASYYALVPDIPPLLPPVSNPRSDLDPNADTAALASRFEGRGLSATFDVSIPLFRDRVLLEASADVAVLRGDTDASYASATSFYTLDDVLLPPPYDVFGEVVESPPGSGTFESTVDGIDQVTVLNGVSAEGTSTTASTIGVQLGARWRVLDWLDVVGGFRTARYTDVGVDLLPGPLAGRVDGALDYSRTSRSATYEGFYVGVSLYVF